MNGWIILSKWCKGPLAKVASLRFASCVEALLTCMQNSPAPCRVAAVVYPPNSIQNMENTTFLAIFRLISALEVKISTPLLAFLNLGGDLFFCFWSSTEFGQKDRSNFRWRPVFSDFQLKLGRKTTPNLIKELFLVFNWIQTEASFQI